MAFGRSFFFALLIYLGFEEHAPAFITIMAGAGFRFRFSPVRSSLVRHNISSMHRDQTGLAQLPMSSFLELSLRIIFQ